MVGVVEEVKGLRFGDICVCPQAECCLVCYVPQGVNSILDRWLGFKSVTFFAIITAIENCGVVDQVLAFIFVSMFNVILFIGLEYFSNQAKLNAGEAHVARLEKFIRGSEQADPGAIPKELGTSSNERCHLINALAHLPR